MLKLLLLTLSLAASALALLPQKQQPASSIVINEVCSRNVSIAVDDGHKAQDYIELYNASDNTVTLNDWYISDDSEDLMQNSLEDIVIPAKGYCVLYADGLGESETSVGFKISQDGESIFLADASGEIIDQVYIPKLQMDCVYGRRRDGDASWCILEATPGKSNDVAEEMSDILLEMPKFSHESGFYEEAFELTMTAGVGETIYYTTDGSMPTEESEIYKNPIRIEKCTYQENVINNVRNIVADWKDYHVTDESADKGCVIRALVKNEHNQKSEVFTATYFVGLEQYKDCNVISITADPEQLIGEEGIFVTGKAYDQWYLDSELAADGKYEQGWTENYELTNFWQCDREDEVLGSVQFFENGKETLNQLTGVRVQGAYNRTKAKKSLQLFSRDTYSGSSLFEQPFFEDYESHAVYLSPSLDKAMLLELADERGLATQQAKKCEVFINGEHWYSGVLMEKYDETYFEEHFGVDGENVLFVKDNECAVGEEYAYLYEDMINYLKDETISQEEKAAMLYEQMDIESFIEWMCFNLYIGNDDVSYKKNSTLWRTIEPDDTPYGDCKWRWMVYDIDHAASDKAKENTDFNSFMLMNSNRFYWALKTNEDFCEQFITIAIDMMETTFLPEHVETVLEKWDEDLSYQDDYFLERPEYMMKSLKNEKQLLLPPC